MTKQQFIDLTPTNDVETITQILLTRMSKTKIIQVKRVLGELTKECPKTWMKETPLSIYLDALNTCDELNKNENEVE